MAAQSAPMAVSQATCARPAAGYNPRCRSITPACRKRRPSPI